MNFSLSPRERAGVRGNGAAELPTTWETTGLARRPCENTTEPLSRRDKDLRRRHTVLRAALGLLLDLALLSPLAAQAQISPTNTATATPPALGTNEVKTYVGSASCRECHEKFYTLWSTSFHGLAMQPYTAELAKTKLTPQKDGCRRRPVSFPRRFGGRGGYRAHGHQRDALPHHADDGRQECVLFSDAAGARLAAGIAGGV